MTYKVTVLGLGAMGSPMAARLATELPKYTSAACRPRVQ